MTFQAQENATRPHSPHSHPNKNFPPRAKAALQAGVMGNWVDNIHMFLPVIALAPALEVLAGPAASATTGAGAGAAVVIAMLLGRPVGGLVFGRLSDKWGRTRTTRLALLGTAVCAAAIALVPTHQVWGVWTFVAVVAARFVGGVFIAGEYSAAIPLAMEWSPPRLRGWFSGLILSMAPWAQASIAFATAMMLSLLGPDAYAVWGWRVLFAFAALASLGMYVFYRFYVEDSAPAHLGKHAQRAAHQRAGRVVDVVAGPFAGRFWQIFVLLSGLWCMTVATVLVLPAHVGSAAASASNTASGSATATNAGLDAGAIALAMGVASVAQALAMAVLGHVSTRIGRRRFFVSWALLAGTVGVGAWWCAVFATSLGSAAAWAAVAQVATVSAYGPVAAYISEAFPARVRSTGYGVAYSFSLILPMLYPLWLPVVSGVMGAQASVVAVLCVGAVLVGVGAALGPAQRSSEELAT